jgi:hypothetical protein
MGACCTHQQMVAKQGCTRDSLTRFSPLLRPHSFSSGVQRWDLFLTWEWFESMWCLPRVYLLSLFLVSVSAFAQPASDPPSAILPRALLPNTAPESGPPSEDEIRTKNAYWHAECIGDWDRQTHMTKKECADTCQRVVDDRVKWRTFTALDGPIAIWFRLVTGPRRSYGNGHGWWRVLGAQARWFTSLISATGTH